MRKLNLIFKITLSFFLIGFAVWYESLLYNLFLVTLFIFVLRKEKISLFRFPRQGYFFALLLLIMFLLRAFNGYGKIILQLPFGFTLTEQGLEMAAVFVTQIILIFLVFGIAIYSTERAQFWYYFKQLEDASYKWLRILQGTARIGIYVMYLLPKSLDYRKEISANLRGKLTGETHSLASRLKIILDNVYQFILNILQRSESEYPLFMEQNKTNTTIAPPPLLNFRHGLIAVLVIGIHANLVWKWV